MPPLQVEYRDDCSLSSETSATIAYSYSSSEESNNSTVAANSYSPKKNNRRSRRKQKSTNSSSSSRNTQKATTPERKDNVISRRQRARIVALDCEMVGVGFNAQQSMLARVCIVNCEGKTIYDTYVQTTARVMDYRTHISGITKEHLLSANGAISFNKCRRQVQEILNGKILVGHALRNDLDALKIEHPWYNIRDTAQYEPYMKYRPGCNDGKLWPRKLKDLAAEKLNRSIQTAGTAHSPYEDAVAALDLYKSVRSEWEKSLDEVIKSTYNQQHQQREQYYYHLLQIQQQQQQQQKEELNMYHYQQQQLYFQQQLLACGIGI